MESSHEWSRRRVIQLAGLGIVGGVAATLASPLTAEAHGTIDRHSEIGGVRTFYEGGGPSTFGYNPGFYARLEKAVRFWTDNTPNEWGVPTEIWTFGAHTDHRP